MLFIYYATHWPCQDCCVRCSLALQPKTHCLPSMMIDGLSTMLNVQLTDDQWIQASLFVQCGRLWFHSVCMLEPSAFLALDTVTLDL